MVKNNFLQPNFADAIESTITAKNFPWYYTGTVNRNDVTYLKEHQLTHLFFAENNPVSNHHEICLPLFEQIEKQFGFRIKKLFRCKANMQLVSDWTEEEQEVLFHTDYEVFTDKRYSLLYYVSDCDGETIIKTKRGHIKITPQKNTAVLIKSDEVHAGFFPKLNRRRLVVNVMFEIA